MNTKDTRLSNFYDGAPGNELLGNIINFGGGNSGLTEEFVYNNQPNSLEERVPILSSATLDINLMGYISRFANPSNKKLKIYKGPCVLVARNGYAGTMTYIPKGEFTINDHAYVLTVKKKWCDRVNLRWFAYQYQGLFYNLVTSKSDNATFNKEYAEQQTIALPSRSFQDKIAEKIKELDDMLNLLEKLKNEIELIKNTEMIY